MKKFNDEDVYDIIQLVLSKKYESDEDYPLIEKYKERLLNKQYYSFYVQETTDFINVELHFKTDETNGMMLSINADRDEYIKYKKIKERKRKIDKIYEHLVN
jgi:hypothetical protein